MTMTSPPNHDSLTCQSCCQSVDGNAVSCRDDVRGHAAPARAVHFAPSTQYLDERGCEEGLSADRSNVSQKYDACWDQNALDLNLSLSQYYFNFRQFASTRLAFIIGLIYQRLLFLSILSTQKARN